MHAVRASRASAITIALLVVVVGGVVQAGAAHAATVRCRFTGGALVVNLGGNDETFTLSDGDGDGNPGVELRSGCGGASYDDLVSLSVKGSAGVAEEATFVAAGDTEWGDFTTKVSLGGGAGAEDVVRLEGEDIAAGGVYTGDTILADSFATYAGVEMVEIYGYDGDDVLLGALSIRNHLDGGSGVDTLAGGSLDDVIHGGDTPEPDDMYGGAGDDVFVECVNITGGDAMNGGDGSDTVDYSGRTGVISVTLPEPGSYTSGNGEDLENDGFMSIENVMTGSGNDSISGSSIANVIDAGPGADTVAGGAGDDRFLEGSDDGRIDVITGGDGRDTVDYSTRGSHIEANIGGPSGEDSLWDGYDIEDLIGTAYDDTLSGGGGGNLIVGLAGDDNIYGRGGNDTLLGGPGLDLLNGLSGDDVLDGGRDGALDEFLAGADSDRCLVEGRDERQAATGCESFRASSRV